MDALKKERIALEVIKTLKSRFDNFPEDALNNRNAPFHEAFLEAFKVKIEKHVTDIPIFISLASWMHGLNTTLGQTFFENISHVLCNGEKREFKGLLINQEQQKTITEIITSLKNKNKIPNLYEENKVLHQAKGELNQSIQNFTADIYFEEDDNIVAIELKTVKPNSGIFKSEKEKILYAKAALKNRYPEKEIYYYLGFPFDPLNETSCGFNKERFFSYGIDFKKFYDHNEVLLADELWDFLSQEKNTMQTILEIINSISTTDFMEKYNLINDKNSFLTDSKKHEAILREWNLFREIELSHKFNILLNKAISNSTIKRLLNNNLFDTKGIYKEDRINSLLKLIRDN
ncbi:MAG: TdeIII family type II restriction endonuclease [Ignavibacteriaceae bacterium]|jgi:hypothetical protein|nr:TdeIII family type II restriction endonuclease [Ignavibacteriaceae bacterium]